MISHVEYYVLEQHRLVLLPLGTRLGQVSSGRCLHGVGTVTGGGTTFVTGATLSVRGGSRAWLARLGSRRPLWICLLLGKHLVVLSIDSISFSLVNDSTLVQEVVTILEGDHLLLLVGVVRLAHGRGLAILSSSVSVACISDHVICKVDHGTILLLTCISLSSRAELLTSEVVMHGGAIRVHICLHMYHLARHGL